MLRVVVDTDFYISCILHPQFKARRCLAIEIDQQVLLFDLELAKELANVLDRPFIARGRGEEVANEIVGELFEKAKMVWTTSRVQACRDPNDDFLLALALDGSADLIITGDNDLLALHPWRGVAIVTPADALALLAPTL